jgi:hypothetical protein
VNGWYGGVDSISDESIKSASCCFQRAIVVVKESNLCLHISGAPFNPDPQCCPLTPFHSSSPSTQRLVRFTHKASQRVEGLVGLCVNQEISNYPHSDPEDRLNHLAVMQRLGLDISDRQRQSSGMDYQSCRPIYGVRRLSDSIPSFVLQELTHLHPHDNSSLRRFTV